LKTFEKDHDRCNADISSHAHSNYEPTVWVQSLLGSAAQMERDKLMYNDGFDRLIPQSKIKGAWRRVPNENVLNNLYLIKCLIV